MVATALDHEITESTALMPTERHTLERLSPQQAITELDTLREFVNKRLKDKEDYGVIPGTNDKKVLLKPGAQKIIMYYNVFPKPIVVKTEMGEGHVEYEVTAELYSRTTGALVGAGVGSCSTMESRYRWRTTKPVCPNCGKMLRKSKKPDEDGTFGWYCWNNPSRGADGCGANIPAGAIDESKLGQVENPDIWDQRNTVLKMAKKRAIVDAAIELSCIGDLFTQDVEENFEDAGHSRTTDPTPPARPAGPRTQPANRTASKAAPIPEELQDLIVTLAESEGSSPADVAEGLRVHLKLSSLVNLPAPVLRKAQEWLLEHLNQTDEEVPV